MKILHTSDIHLDSPLTTRLSSDRIRERKRELLFSFKRCVDLAVRGAASGFIISGDLFDSEKVSRATLEYVLSVIEATPTVNFFYLFGNHERDALVRSGLALPKNLKLFEDGWTYYRFADTTVVGRCTTEKGMFDSLMLEGDKRNIVVLHGELADHSDVGGKIGKNELSALPIDYVALGHYHTYGSHELSARTTAVYPGTPEGRGFDEVGDKGVVMLEVGPYGISHSFIKTCERTLRTVEVDVSTNDTAYLLECAVENATRGIDSRDIVRVILTGERDVTRELDTDALTNRLAHRFYYFECRDESRMRISVDDYINDKTLKGEFIRGVLSDERLTDEEQKRVVAMGLRALHGAEID